MRRITNRQLWMLKRKLKKQLRHRPEIRLDEYSGNINAKSNGMFRQDFSSTIGTRFDADAAKGMIFVARNGNELRVRVIEIPGVLIPYTITGDASVGHLVGKSFFGVRFKAYTDSTREEQFKIDRDLPEGVYERLLASTRT